jgi:hypothetical protein
MDIIVLQARYSTYVAFSSMLLLLLLLLLYLLDAYPKTPKP